MGVYLGQDKPTGTNESAAQRLYREAYPGDATLSDLSNWESLEAEHPRLFNNYFFWCQKPADGASGSSPG